MRTRTKILIAILAALLYFTLTQRFSDPGTPAPSFISLGLPKDLDKWNQAYNDEYFSDRLPKDILIDWSEHDPNWMASTNVLPDGRFHIAMNSIYCRAERTAHLTLLHEDCHVLNFKELSEGKRHGPKWQTCMEDLHQQGAFKVELIDRE